MSDIKPPTQEELLDDKFECVHREVDDSWRHGVYVHEVYYRDTDDTYWAVNYALSNDGEVNGLRQNDYDISRVKPVERTIVDYVRA